MSWYTWLSAAPEQYGSQDHKGKARPEDIYCLGATLHHLITGRNPAATPFNFPPITQCRTTLLEDTARVSETNCLVWR
ncbi:MAG: hypothetical protein ACLVAT_05300 [Lachnospiraceae bacterium]